MADLFPTEAVQSSPDPSETAPQTTVTFGKSWRFDFEAGEFVLTPTGKVVETKDAEAWKEWCKKALATARYRHLVYSRNYGQEFEDLLTRNLNRAANESEIKRIATETLMADPRTAAVRNFTFTWEEDRCLFSCEVTNVLEETASINGVVIT
jgi:hypothetical protein